ncbi:MAG: hypothetical protein BGO43_05280 [Gammaproteobacteria bacterium 39-13]|nr:hypothetical protein [Gammaproteobacteria bacterium]OJV96254.1 MAG: hypothetical protein BGO43_05280 [Gammaproteobacteria bacterium 39-13]
MKIWKLTPVNGSGYVRIRAPSEMRAREIAFKSFVSKEAHRSTHPTDWQNLSWQDAKQVTCILEEDDISDEEGFLDIVKKE